MRPVLLAVAALAALALPASAAQPPVPAETAYAQGETAKPKPKRARSEAQKRNDARLRACGAEWRKDKEALTKKGYTWIKYSVECRKRLASQGR